MSRENMLTKNVGTWDRIIRFSVGVLIVVAVPLWVRSPWWLALLGAFGGGQIITAINGY